MKSLLLPKTLFGLSLFITINTAHAENFSYNYVEGGVNHYLGDGSDITSFKLYGSIDIAEDANLLAGLKYSSLNIEGSDVDLNEYKLGAGMHQSIRPNTDFITELSIINAAITSSWYNVSGNAVMVGAGLRQHINDKIEGHVQLNGYKSLESENSFSAELIVGGRLHINEQISGGLDYTQPDSGSDGMLTTSIRLQSL